MIISTGIRPCSSSNRCSIFCLPASAKSGAATSCGSGSAKGRSLLFGLSGAAILIVYGIVPTLQPEGNFGRVYAAYGGIFIALSILWGWLIDNVQPDRFDIIGGIVALTGVAIIMYAPR